MKRVPQLSPAEAARLVPSGAVMMVGGFGMTGTPVHLLHALAETDVRDLTYIANNIGEPGLVSLVSAAFQFSGASGSTKVSRTHIFRNRCFSCVTVPP